MFLQHLDERHRVPRQPVQVIVGDVVGDALVPRAVQVDLPRRPDDGADRTERSGPRDPELRRPGEIAHVGLPPEHQHVEVVGLHLSQRPLAPTDSQCPLVGQDLSFHRPYGAYG